MFYEITYALRQYLFIFSEESSLTLKLSHFEGASLERKQPGSALCHTIPSDHSNLAF